MSSRIWKGLISLWICFHLLTIFVTPNRETYLGFKLSKVLEPYANSLELAANWNFFAPQPGPPMRFEYEGVPRFSPEHFAGISIKDPMKRKQLKKGLDQLAEEGVVQVYKQRGFGDKDPILGAVGALQFEVLQHRLAAEYAVDVKIERLPFIHCRWVTGAGFDPDEFERREDSRCLEDRDGQPVLLFKSDWGLRWAEENHKGLQFLKHAPQIRGEE